MSKKQYPYESSRVYEASNYDAECAECKRVIPKGVIHVVVVTQVSWFRGEDEVDHICESCATRPPRRRRPTNDVV